MDLSTKTTQSASNKKLLIYTDGAARGNPGRGGYGVVMLWGNTRKELKQGYQHTTNNRMELMAVIAGLEALTRSNVEVAVYSDSKYVVDSVTKGWLQGWVKKNFKDKKNVDLWKRYLAVAKQHIIKFHWVKGHADNPLNNRCDQLATEAADRGPWLVDEGFGVENGSAGSKLL